MISFQLTTGDVLTLVALILSAYSVWTTNRFGKRQLDLEARNAELSELLIAKETEEVDSAKRAAVTANFYKIGRSEYRLKVFNRGKSAARNLRIEIVDGGDLFSESDISRKFPVPLLEQHGSIELVGRVHFGSPARAHLIFRWDDESGSDRFAEAFPTW